MRAPWIGFVQGRPNPVVLGRKFCPRCGRWRLVCDFGLARKRGQLKVRSYCATCQYRSNLRAEDRRTAEQLARWREYQRIWHEVKRREAGIAPRDYNYDPSNPKRRRTVIDRPERILLDPAPLIPLIARSTANFTNMTALARRSGVSKRSILRYRTGEARHIRVDVADRLAIALGVPLSLIYLETEAA